MTVEALSPAAPPAPRKRRRFRLPERVPPFNTQVYRIFSVVWFAALLLAIVGPIGGLYERYMAPGDNSQLIMGSRAGFAVDARDATKIRFRVGPYSREVGIRKGDDIIAIYGLPMPEKMPVTEKVLDEHADDPAYIAMGNLLFGTESMPVPLTVRSQDGSIREVTVTTGEQHMDAAARALGISPTLLSFIDIVHVIFYPFLIWAAWILHRRNARDAVSSILSLAILLMISAELPSSSFLDSIGVPFWANAALYDLNNVLLIAGIVLFPYGKLTSRRVALLCAAPVLLVLRGVPYNAWLIGLWILGVLIQIRSLRAAESSDLKNQIRWALFGFSGYVLFRTASYAADTFKWFTGSFATQISFEVAGGLTLGLSVLVLQGGLLVALLRFRLYDAEAIISRTASIGIMAIGLTAIIAGVMEGIITAMQDIYPQAQTQAAMAGAVVATVFFHPLHERVQKWVEKRFHKGVIQIREQLPELMRDTRDSASLEEFLSEVLSRIVDGFHATRAAVVLEREVKQTVGVDSAEVLRWLVAFQPKEDRNVLDCVPEDHTFPLRLEIETISGAFGWLLIGPRPDGSIAGKDEQEALENIAGTLGRSIRIVLAREHEKQELLHLLEASTRRIDRIERLLKIKP
ncbi:MAG TPA: hypothetical protein VFO51_04460 [Sphingomicrobium sp.]|nr:hypothetical protein [Sphingomicrobium sp.]